jgi:hypothetical protein
LQSNLHGTTIPRCAHAASRKPCDHRRWCITHQAPKATVTGDPQRNACAGSVPILRVPGSCHCVATSSRNGVPSHMDGAGIVTDSRGGPRVQCNIFSTIVLRLRQMSAVREPNCIRISAMPFSSLHSALPNSKENTILLVNSAVVCRLTCTLRRSSASPLAMGVYGGEVWSLWELASASPAQQHPAKTAMCSQSGRHTPAQWIGVSQAKSFPRSLFCNKKWIVARADSNRVIDVHNHSQKTAFFML